jgi:hypothetical protein
MVVNGVINSGQSALNLADVVTSGNFSAGNFLKGLSLTGFAGQNIYTTGQDIDKYEGANASQELGQQVGSIAWDAASMFVPAPLRRLFAVGNVIEAGKEALSGNWLDAVQNLLTAGMQFAGVQGPKELGAKITATNPTLTTAVTGLADDIPRNLQLRASLKKTPTPMQLKNSGALTEYGPNPLSRKDVVAQIRSTNESINTNAGIVTQQLRTEASNLTAKAAQKAGSGWQHVSSNFNAGRNIAHS